VHTFDCLYIFFTLVNLEVVARLDARTKKQRPGMAFPPSGQAEGKGYQVVISDMSLGGASLEGDLPPGDRLILEFAHEGQRIRLWAEILRKGQGGTAVRFLHQSKEEVLHLWSVLREDLKGGVEDDCPYCGEALHQERECPHCGLSRDFDRDGYLLEHLRRTVGQRLRWRLERLNADRLLSLLTFVDGQLLGDLGRGEQDEEFVGTCDGMLEVFSLIRKVAPTDIPVLILGESGTGKELTAKAIHERSQRQSKPFVVINCAAIPETLLEAELFGYERGAFTGAYTARKGKVEQAHGGTLFLDEIGDLPIGLQAKLLRFLEDGTVERIGSRRPRRVDVRIIAATNCDLEDEVRKGRFRQDLFYRLNAFTIQLPPLRERGKDKVVLANYFLKRLCKENGTRRKRFSDEALLAIGSYRWPGNVREMINKIRKALVVSKEETITPEDLSLEAPAPKPSPQGIKALKEKVEREGLLRALEATGYNISRTARLLGVSRPTVYNLMKRYGIS